MTSFESSVGSFPERLKHILAGSNTRVAKVECVVFPAYEVRFVLNCYKDTANSLNQSFQTKGELVGHFAPMSAFIDVV